MFMIGPAVQRISWAAASITLDLIPLPADKDQEFIKATLTEVRDEKNNLIDVKRDHVRYAQLVGCYCIKGWAGVVDGDKTPLECDEASINAFMLVNVAEAFLFNQVKGLALHVTEEIEAGKSDSASEYAG